MLNTLHLITIVALVFWTISAHAEDSNPEVIDYLYITRDYPEPPPLSLLEKILDDEGVQGGRFSNRDNNRTARMFKREFELKEFKLGASGFEEIKQQLVTGTGLVIADLKKNDLLNLSSLPEASNAIILNIRAGEDELRVKECRKNVFHMVPSRAMRTDALAQYLIWKKWNLWFLISGKEAPDKAYAEAIMRSAKRFGGKIIEQRSYKLETGNRRVETGHQQIQTQMPMLTRNAEEHDVVFVADESESFGLYMPYRTAEPRPVVGTYGMVATAWHRSFEQYGGARLQNDFEEFAGRTMTERDYLAWLSIKLFGKAVLRSEDKSLAGIRQYILSENMDLAGYKGRPMSFRLWNQQLRQPILLSSARSLVSMAPLDGFLHPTHYTDTLGFDKADSSCALNIQ